MMLNSNDENDRFYDILILGIERKGLTAPKEPIRTRNFCLHFEPFTSPRRFNEFNGVILFQGVFETFEWKSPAYSSSYVVHKCDVNELDKRKKEASLLLGNGGFLCFLLNEQFFDRHDGDDFRSSDLAKYHLNYSDFYRENFSKRIAHVEIKLDEFRKFLNVYGAASSHFHHYNKSIEWRVIAEAVGKVTGMIIDKNEYFVPTLIPDNRPEIIEEYFKFLAEAITSTCNKFHHSLPEWVNEFRFEEETTLETERLKLVKLIEDINFRTDELNNFKAILALSDDELVTYVARIFQNGFNIAVDLIDELREDFKLVNDNKDVFCLCEVKGTNKGVKREHINQADSHRERSGYDSTFASLLIMNTNIKSARSISEKDQELAKEQIRHAKKMNILVLRTLDLIELLRLFLAGVVTRDDVCQLLTMNAGWLKVTRDGHTVITD